MRSYHLLIFLLLPSLKSFSQNLSAKSNEISLDFSDLKKNYSISIPTIAWTQPTDTISYLTDDKFAIKAEVKSMYGLNSVDLRVRDRKNKKIVKEIPLLINQALNNYLSVNQSLILPAGEFEIELIAENMEGFSARVSRIAIVEIKMKK